MEVSKVSETDGIACVQLIKAFTIAKFNGLNGTDIEALTNARKWLAELAGKMGRQLQAGLSAQPQQQQIKVKSMGPIPTSSVAPTPKQKKRKK